MRYGLLLLLVVLAAGAYLLVPRPAYPEVAELAENQDRSFTQFSTYFRELAERKGAPYAFEVLFRAPLPPDTDPHLLGHIIGDMLYKQQGTRAIAACTDDLRNACSHSVVIGILSDFGEQSLPDIAKTCELAPGGPGAYNLCYHGLGHGVLAYVGYDFAKAMELCKRTGTLERGGREHIECVGGAVMEMIAGIHDPQAWRLQRDTYLKPDDPTYVCEAPFMPKAAREMCYLYVTPHLLTSAGLPLSSVGPHEYADAFTQCDQVRGDKARRACYGGFGKEFVGIARGLDIRDVGSMRDEELRNVHAWCDQAPTEEGKSACRTYALSSLFWGGEVKPDAAFQFCASTEARHQGACYLELAHQIKQYLPGTAQGVSLCARLPEAFRIPCAP